MRSGRGNDDSVVDDDVLTDVVAGEVLDDVVAGEVLDDDVLDDDVLDDDDDGRAGGDPMATTVDAGSAGTPPRA